jgi:hypothetical protein
VQRVYLARWRKINRRQYQRYQEDYRTNHRGSLRVYSRLRYRRDRYRIRALLRPVEREKWANDKVFRAKQAVKSRIAGRRQRHQLSNRYVRGLLKRGSRLSAQDFPPELVETQRKLIKIHRALKSL